MASFQILPVPPRVKDHTGSKFDRLTVIGFVGMDSGVRPRPRFLCACDCGKMHTAQAVSLVKGYVRSCGCLQSECGRRNIRLAIDAGREVNRIRHTTHGMSHTPEHNAWTGMKQRCHNPRNKMYKHYGARGVTVCDRWRDSFENFLADMGPRPSAKHSIDRINVNGQYAPENCRWALAEIQANNRTDNHIVVYQGQRVSLSEAERLSGVSQKNLYYRSKKGWVGDKLFAPVRSQ